MYNNYVKVLYHRSFIKIVVSWIPLAEKKKSCDAASTLLSY